MESPSTITLRREPGPLTRSLVALLLRVGLGLSFLMFGLAKFQAIKNGQYPAMITDQFAKSPLRPDMVKLFADVLPYAEVALGSLLLAGLFTTLSATLSGILLLHLTFGKLVLNDIPSMPSMFTYLLVNAAVLWLAPVTSNYVSLDGLFFGWFWKPRSHGEYVREEAGTGRRMF
jgi:thiosulfate dehydrogenase [quinone] large subunit